MRVRILSGKRLRSAATLYAIFGLLFTAQFASAQPSSRPATRHVNEVAETWFDEAAEALDEWIASSAKDGTISPGVFLDERGTAMVLCELRGRESDRALLRRAAQLSPREKGSVVDQSFYKFSQLVERAELRLALGELEIALADLRQAEEMANTAKSPMGALIPSDAILAGPYVKFGNIEAAWDCARRTDQESLVLGLLADSGHAELRDRLLRDWLARLDPDSSERFGLTESLLRRNEFALVDEVIAPAPVSWKTVRVRSRYARHAAAMGQVDRANEQLDMALSQVRTLENPDRFRCAFAVADFASEVNRIDVFREAVALFSSAMLQAEQPDRWDDWIRLAEFAAALNAEDEFARYLEIAQKAAANLEQDERAKYELAVAAAYARRGKAADARAWFDRSRASNPLENYWVSEEFTRMIYGLIDSGLIDEALAEGQRCLKPDSRGLDDVYDKASFALRRRGDVSAAWEMARRIGASNYHRRIACLRAASASMIAAGQEGALRDRVNALSPDERARLCLCIAADFLGKPEYGFLMFFKEIRTL